MDTAVEQGDLLPYRHGAVLLLDEELVVLAALVKRHLRDLVHVGAELGERLELIVLGLVHLEGTGDLLHGLDLGAAADSGYGDTDIYRRTEALVEQ